jgi:hypothetical protein
MYVLLDEVRRSCSRTIQSGDTAAPSLVTVDRAAAAAFVATLPEPAALRAAAAKVPGCTFPVRMPSRNMRPPSSRHRRGRCLIRGIATLSTYRCVAV